MTARQKANCQKLCDFIASLPSGAFNINTIISKLDAKGKTACGCVSGYLPTVFPRSFEIDKLSSTDREDYHPLYPNTIATVTSGGSESEFYATVERLMGLSYGQWIQISEPESYHTKRITKPQVVKRIKEVAKL